MFDLYNVISSELPAIFVSNIVPLPNIEMRIDVSKKANLEALKNAEAYRNYIAIVVQDSTSDYKLGDTSVAKYALIGKISLNMAIPNNMRRIRLQVVVRCKVNEFTQVKPFPIVSVTSVPSVEGTESENSIELIAQEKELLITKINNFLNQKGANNCLEIKETDKINLEVANVEITSDIIAFALKLGYKEKIKYLECEYINTRLKYILEDLNKQDSYAAIDKKIEDDVRKSINEGQKEYYLREKMKAIQEELGDKAKRDEDIEKLRTAIKEAALPKTMEEKALNELGRYQSTPSNSPESAIIKTYLDFILSLPWSKTSEDNKDINNAKRILDEDHYGLTKVKDRILEYLAVRIMTNENPQSILCLVGPPGVGKTSLARSVARALNKTFVKVSLGGVKDESEIRGHRRTYIGALPGRIMQSLSKAKTKNPVFLLDEIDKMSSDYKGDPTSAMLEVLDSEQNKYFSDHYLEEPFDLSQVFFIATANYLGNIPAPLRDRMEIVEVSSYTEYEKYSIAKEHLIKKQLKAHGLDENKFQISDQAIFKIIQSYTREAGVRELERLIGSLIRKAIKQFLMDGVENVEITALNLEEYLGKEKFLDNQNEENDTIGVVNGLAYTEFGGDTLSIEVTMYKGEGRLMLTGKLGDVMKESAQAALSYVKSNADKYQINYDVFKQNDIHIHVPEGAIPKDGPSAGVTIATAIISAAANKPVHHEIGMTGEITLRGRVLAIGGLREKSIAAHRTGLKKILIPKENIRDLDEIPESVKNSIQIIPVNTVDEVAKYAIKWE